MTYHVFIPSRGRSNVARLLANVWHNESFEVNFVVEPDEVLEYAKTVEDCKVHPLPHSDRGIGASRHHCLDIAASLGCKAIILADDDIKPGRDAHMAHLLACAKHSKVLGITARYSYHDLCLGYGIKNKKDLILLPTGTFRLVALNVDNIMTLGNYDKNLEYAEDCDIFLRGLQAGFPWLIHLGTWSNSLGNRYQPGGMLDYVNNAYSHADLWTGEEKLKIKKKDWHEALYDKYPDFVNDPAKANFSKQNSIRVSWRKAYDKFIPGWKNYSSIHGGSLERYFNET